MVGKQNVTPNKEANEEIIRLQNELSKYKERSQQELNSSRELLRSVSNVTPTSIACYTAVRDNNQIIDFECIFQNNANKQDHGGESLEGQRIADMNPWMRETKAFKSFVKAVETGETQTFEEYYNCEIYGKWRRVTVVKLGDGITTSTEDITAFKKTEQEINDQAYFIRSITDRASAIISITTHPAGETLYINKDPFADLGFDADEFIKMTREERLKFVHPDDVPKIREFYAWFNNPPKDQEVRIEYRIKNKAGEWLWIDTRGKIFKLNTEGKVSHILNIAQDITAQKKAEAEILRLKDEIAEKAMDKYLSLFNSIDEGFCIMELLYDQDENIMDMVFREQNPSFHKLSGLGNVIGKKVSELLPNLEKHWISIFMEVARTGKTVRSENYARDLDRWYSAHYLKVRDDNSPFVAVVFDDITERKRREANMAFLNEVTESLIHMEDIDKTVNAFCKKIGVYFGAAVCAISEVNEAEATVSAPYIWHRSGAPSPTGVYRIDEYHSKAVQQLMRSGKPEIVRNTADFPEAVAKNMKALKIGAYVNLPFVRSGVWRATLSITDSKPRAWREDEIDLMGDLTFRIWTRLERARAEEALQASEKRLQELNENLEQQVQKRTKELTKLKVEQEKERLNNILIGQEQERTRIGEGLHNGVAQLLYAVQNNLQTLMAHEGNEKPALTSALATLSDAIRDTRYISFELMPPVLKDFGLKVAIETFMQRIFTGRIQVSLHVVLDRRLSEKLEISLYRIIQEIMSNIVKHSNASQATVEIFTSYKYIHLKVEDNGAGFIIKTAKKMRRGIGLQSMENRVKLLDGKMKIQSQPDLGTTIEIKLPIKSPALNL